MGIVVYSHLSSNWNVISDKCLKSEILPCPLSPAGIMLTLEVQGSLDPKAPLKDFVQALGQVEKFQQQVAEIKKEVEAFAAQFPMPGLPEL